MSVEALAVALHHTKATNPTTKLVLTGIANHDGEGGSWPSIATLAKYALCSERTAQRAVKELVALGEVKVEAQAGGLRDWRNDKRPNLYRFLLRCPPNCDRSTSHNLEEVPAVAVPDSPDGVTPVTPGRIERGDAHVTPLIERGDTTGMHGVTPPVERGDTAVSPKPSLEPSMEGGGRARRSAAPAARTGTGAQKRAHQLPEAWRPPTAVMAEMRQECPRIDQEFELRKFRDHYGSLDDRLALRTDWSMTYRNWIRNSHPPQRSKCEPKPITQPGYHQTPDQVRRDRLDKAGDLIPPRDLTPAQEQAWLRAARQRIADGLPIDDIGDVA